MGLSKNDPNIIQSLLEKDLLGDDLVKDMLDVY